MGIFEDMVRNLLAGREIQWYKDKKSPGRPKELTPSPDFLDRKSFLQVGGKTCLSVANSGLFRSLALTTSVFSHICHIEHNHP